MILGSLRKVRRFVPRPLIRGAKWLFVVGLDLRDWTFGRDENLPPRRLVWDVGDGSFEEIGEEFLQYFKSLGNLQPNQRVLDVGCGVGRMTLPLTEYLDPSGSYVGMDIVKDSIDWASRNITSGHPNFRFIYIDIFNGAYNPAGKIKASEYRFPFPDKEFDFVFLTSVFTHLLPDDLHNYVREIARVTRMNGTCFATLFLLNAEVDRLIGAGKSTRAFPFRLDGYAIEDKRDPERAVGYDEKYVKTIFKANSLEIQDPVYYGSWSGRGVFTSYQDIVVASKLGG